MSDTVLEIRNLSKLYRLGEVGTGTLSHDLNRWWARLRGKDDPTLQVGQVNRRDQAGNSDYVWALKDVDFDVKRGEILGIIGANGAGKSTLLKLISRITAPSTGHIRAKGRIASLLEVGTGMHPEMTARENIYLNGAILGMRRREIARRFDEILDFAGCALYVDTPVKRYSSGMRVRLGFAVAAFLEPEILIVDEVLAVGDAEFQQKCLGKMHAVAEEGRTILFVSHNLLAVKALCSRALLLEQGGLRAEGSVDQILGRYTHSFAGTNGEWTRPSQTPYGLLGFERVQLRMEGTSGRRSLVVDVVVRSGTDSQYRPAFLALDILDSTLTPLMQAQPRHEGYIAPSGDGARETLQVVVELPDLIPGHYYVSPWIGPTFHETYDVVPRAIMFEILDTAAKNRTQSYSRDHGFLVARSSVTPSS